MLQEALTTLVLFVFLDITSCGCRWHEIFIITLLESWWFFFHPGPLQILAHRTSVDEDWGVNFFTSEMQGPVFRLHETILKKGEPGSLGNKIYDLD